MNVKILSMMLAALLTAASAQAQFHVGARAGLNVSTMTGETVPVITDGPGVEGKIGFQAGAVGELALGRVFSVQPSLLFSTAGYTSRSPEGFNEAEMSYGYNYLHVPLNALVKLPIGQRGGIFIYLGPYAAYALNGKYKMETFEDKKSVKTDKVNVQFGKEGMKRFDAGAGFGLGFRASAVQVDLGMTMGMVNLNNNEGYDIKNANMALAFSYFFN
jgi:hypothetical protein